MTTCVIHYGHKRFLPLLIKWLEQFAVSGNRNPVVIICDTTCELPREARPFSPTTPYPLSYLRFDVNKYPAIIRSSDVRGAFDCKGSLILQAIQQLGRCIVMDTDVWVQKRLNEKFSELPWLPFSMGEDPLPRNIRGLDRPVIEKQAGVLYFGTESPADRAYIMELYFKWFPILRPANDGAMLEQITWTMVWDQLMTEKKAFLLPKELNWSHLWGWGRPNIYLLHEHGPGKWNKIKGAEIVNGKLSPEYRNVYYAAM